MRTVVLSDLLGGTGESAPNPPRPLVEAQIDELKARWVAYNDIPSLKVGDLVRYKHGLGGLKPEMRNSHVMVLWRWLDDEDFVDQQMIKAWVREGVIASTFDCVVAMIGDDGAITYNLAEYFTLQPW